MLLLLLLPLAWALDIPTPTADARVYKVPTRWKLPVRAVSEAAGRTERKVWVVAYEKVIDGSIAPGRASETEDAIEQVWASWEAREDGVFSPQLDALVLLGMDDREVRVRMGSEWDARLGLHNDRLLPLIDTHFLPRAAASDYDGGLAALVTAVDRAVGEGLAAIEKRAAEEVAAAEQRASALKAEGEAAERRAEAKKVRDEEERIADEARAAQVRAAAPWGGGGLVVVGLGAGAALRRRRARAAEASFRAGVAERRGRLDGAETTFASFRVDTELRDRIVELRLKGPVTLAAFKEVSTTLDRIQVGLAALRERLDTLERGVVAGPLAAAPWLAAEAALDAPFAVETGRIQHRLFASPSETVEIAPLPFMEALEADYTRARAGWERLLDAVDATLRRATDDLTAEPLALHHAALDAAGLPRAWADAHPLAADAAAAWAALEALRAADPVAYLDALDAALAGATEAAETVATVLTGKAEAEAARVLALAVPDTADTVVDVPQRDPALALALAEALHAALGRMLQAPGATEVEAAEIAADATVAAWEDLADRKATLTRTVASVAGACTAAEKRVADLHARFAATQASVHGLAGEHAAHTMGGVWREVQETATDLAEAGTALGTAREALAARRHVAAEVAVERVLVEHGEALANLDQLVGVMGRLVAAKADVLRQLATLDEARAGFATELASYGSYGHPSVLGGGDHLHTTLRGEPTTGPVDWQAREERLRAVLGAWADATRLAAAAWRAEQERLRRIREEEERQRRLAREAEERRQRAARAAASAAAAAATRSAYRSSSSSSGFSGGRSGGSSFGGGGGRSGGSSFGGGGGRSGGRKF
ncbi:MAG: TPM domain-containing protein [Myxococcota bacterium]